jgi:hypothetical protein
MQASTRAGSEALTRLQLGQQDAGHIETPSIRVIEPAWLYRLERTAMSRGINCSIHRKSCLGQEWADKVKASALGWLFEPYEQNGKSMSIKVDIRGRVMIMNPDSH